jgi:hypothetical protein
LIKLGIDATGEARKEVVGSVELPDDVFNAPVKQRYFYEVVSGFKRAEGRERRQQRHGEWCEAVAGNLIARRAPAGQELVVGGPRCGGAELFCLVRNLGTGVIV